MVLALLTLSAICNIFRSPRDVPGHVSPSALTFLQITDVHSDPFYDVTQYGCGNKACTRNVSLQDAKTGKPSIDHCAEPSRVPATCGPFNGDAQQMSEIWHTTIRPCKRCPCGVAFSNPPYSVIPPLRSALEDFLEDGFGAKVVIYTGDLAGHYMPGTSLQLSDAGCTTAHAVVKSTIDLLNVPEIEHFFVMGNNDVIPKGRPLTHEWLQDLGSYLLERDWLTEEEIKTWNLGGFFWRPLTGSGHRKDEVSGLCAIGLNSNHWTPTQVNHEMRQAQLQWLPGVLSRSGETAVCTSGFLIVSHIGVVVPGAPVHGGRVVNGFKLWGAEKTDPQQVGEVRSILNRYSDAIVSEIAGDLNKEYIYATGARNWGFTAVGVSQRGGNDPGFHRVFLTADGSQITEIESYQMKRGCEFEFGHSFVNDYAPHFDAGITPDSVATLLSDGSKMAVRQANIAPNAAGITKAMTQSKAYVQRVREGLDGCLAADGLEAMMAPRADSSSLAASLVVVMCGVVVSVAVLAAWVKAKSRKQTEYEEKLVCQADELLTNDGTRQPSLGEGIMSVIETELDTACGRHHVAYSSASEA